MVSDEIYTKFFLKAFAKDLIDFAEETSARDAALAQSLVVHCKECSEEEQQVRFLDRELAQGNISLEKYKEQTTEVLRAQKSKKTQHTTSDKPVALKKLSDLVRVTVQIFPDGKADVFLVPNTSTSEAGANDPVESDKPEEMNHLAGESAQEKGGADLEDEREQEKKGGSKESASSYDGY